MWTNHVNLDIITNVAIGIVFVIFAVYTRLLNLDLFRRPRLNINRCRILTQWLACRKGWTELDDSLYDE